MLLAAGCVLGLGATATLAAWNDQEHAKSTITAGTFALESQVLGGVWASNGATAVTLPLNATGLKPGDTRATWVQIRTTAGSVAGNVSLTGVALGTAVDPTVNPNLALGNALTVRIGPVATTAGCTTTYAGGALATGIGVLPPGVAATALTGDMGSVATYCVVVNLPASAPNEAQGGNVTPTWTFTGTSS